ncbi:hypothetical protein Anapl_06734 [Anas platyrhynchos]|uniref:Uncharacterized protein n=1 Tax=Anas platyrhynchos TaxID=8839 RepID=R0M0X7_ANAPL|nr:hypothetical protein Anapl_06734 [Anas platyrhynchos]
MTNLFDAVEKGSQMNSYQEFHLTAMKGETEQGRRKLLGADMEEALQHSVPNLFFERQSREEDILAATATVMESVELQSQGGLHN